MAWLYKRNGSDNWWIGYRIGGKQFLRSTGTPDEAEAKKELAKLNTISMAHRSGNLTDEFYQLLTGRGAPRITLLSALNDWLAEAKASTAPKTLEKYEAVANGLIDYLGATDKAPLLADVTSETVRSFLNKRRETVSASTVNLCRKVLSVFFRRELANEHIRSNPMLPIKTFKAGQDEKQARRAFSLEEIKTLHAKAPTDFWRYMVVSGFYLGQRMGDLITLRWGSVDFSENIIRLTTIKTNTSLKIPMAKPLRDLLLSLRPGQTKPTDFVWPEQAADYLEHGANAFSNEFYDLMASAGLVAVRQNKKATKSGRAVKRNLSPVSFHCLRHTFVSLLKISGGSQAVAKELAGHSSDLVNDNYTHIPHEVLAQAINQLPEVCK